MKPLISLSLRLRSLHRGGRILFLFGVCTFFTKAVSGQEGAKVKDAPPAPPLTSSLALLQQIEEGLSLIAKEVNRSVVTIEGKSVRKVARVQSAEHFTVFRSLSTLSNEKSRTREEQTKEDKTKDEKKESPDSQETDLLQFLGEVGGSATGSGFLIAGGYVVTTVEVSARIKEPMVVLSSGERVSAEVVKDDKEANISLLKLARIPENTGLKWGDSDRIQPGYFAITIGNQGGFANSISLGLIAGRGRSGKSGEVRYNDLIQFQGIVGKGGSGSPLINARGEVIGMIVATPALPLLVQQEPRASENQKLFINTSGFSSVGFALPSNELRTVVERLLSNRLTAKLGWLGVNLASPLIENTKNSTKIFGIYKGGPADKAGLKYGDIVLSVNDVKVANADALRKQLRKIGAGEVLRITVKRAGKEMTLTATIEPRPSDNIVIKMPLITELDLNH